MRALSRAQRTPARAAEPPWPARRRRCGAAAPARPRAPVASPQPTALTPLRRAPQPGESMTLWLKHKTEDNQWTRLFSMRVDPSTSVDAFIRRYVSELKLGLHPSHVQLLHPKCLPGALDASKEAQATQLDPGAHCATRASRTATCCWRTCLRRKAALWVRQGGFVRRSHCWARGVTRARRVPPCEPSEPRAAGCVAAGLRRLPFRSAQSRPRSARAPLPTSQLLESPCES